jgi:hypothetical protein
MIPGKVALEGKVVQVSAGDSHTAALTDDGIVHLWGCFRVSGDMWKDAGGKLPKLEVERRLELSLTTLGCGNSKQPLSPLPNYVSPSLEEMP